MAQTANLFIVTLERELKRRKAARHALARRERKLDRQLSIVRRQLARVSGNGNNGHARTSRPKNEKSLRETILVVLGRSKHGYTLDDLADKVRATGYKSHSKDFRNVVYQCIYNCDDVAFDADAGKYRLKG